MIRVVVTGSECTGKTTLALSLARHYRAPSTPEYARGYLETRGGDLTYADVDPIARGQAKLVDEAIARAPQLLVHDTDLLSTIVYARHYYGECPDWLEAALSQRRPDLYLLAGIDVPWQPDGQQRDRGDRREEMQALFRDALVERGFRFVELAGSAQVRLRLAIEAIDALAAPRQRAGTARDTD